LNYFVVEQGNAFAEEVRLQIDLLDNLSRFEADFPKRGLSFAPRAFIEETVALREALRERVCVVGICRHDFERVLLRTLRGIRIRRLRCQKQAEGGQHEEDNEAGSRSIHFTPGHQWHRR
jgi:hypothetical protein